MLVAINGPKVAHCDSLVKDSMADYRSNFKNQDGWHFTRRSEDIMSLFISKFIDKHTK